MSVAPQGYTVENQAKECPLVMLRLFGPGVNSAGSGSGRLQEGRKLMGRLV